MTEIITYFTSKTVIYVYIKYPAAGEKFLCKKFHPKISRLCEKKKHSEFSPQGKFTTQKNSLFLPL